MAVTQSRRALCREAIGKPVPFAQPARRGFEGEDFSNGLSVKGTMREALKAIFIHPNQHPYHAHTAQDATVGFFGTTGRIAWIRLIPFG